MPRPTWQRGHKAHQRTIRPQSRHLLSAPCHRPRAGRPQFEQGRLVLGDGERTSGRRLRRPGRPGRRECDLRVIRRTFLRASAGSSARVMRALASRARNTGGHHDVGAGVVGEFSLAGLQVLGVEPPQRASRTNWTWVRPIGLSVSTITRCQRSVVRQSRKPGLCSGHQRLPSRPERSLRYSGAASGNDSRVCGNTLGTRAIRGFVSTAGCKRTYQIYQPGGSGHISYTSWHFVGGDGRIAHSWPEP
jgi:hypothetical protein